MGSKLYPIQPDFSGGELSPRMFGRTDTERYRRGLKTSLNYMISPQGSLFKRPGFELIEKSAATDPEAVRLVNFPQSQRSDLLVEFKEDVITLWGPEGRIRNDDDINRSLLENGSFNLGNNGLQGWQTRQRVYDKEQNKTTYNNAGEVNFARETPVSVEGLLYLYSAASYNFNIYFVTEYTKMTWLIFWEIEIPHVELRVQSNPIISTAEITQRVSIPDNVVDEDFTLRLRCGGNVLAPGVNRYNRGEAVTSGSGKQVTFNGPGQFLDYGDFVGDDGRNNPTDIDREIDIIFKGYAVISEGPYGQSPIKTVTINSPGNHDIIFNPGGRSSLYITLYPETATGHIDGEVDGDSITEIDPFYYFNVYDASIFVNSAGPIVDEYISFANPFPKDAIHDIRVVSDSATNTMFMFHQSTEPRVLTLSLDGTFINFTTMTLAGIAGVDAASGWPRGGEIHQGRMWLYSTPSFPSRLWASEAGDYFQYTAGNNPESPIDKSVSTKGTIYWMKSIQDLFVIGTDQGCYYMASQGAAITPQDVGVRRFSNAGAADIDATDISNRIAFVGRNGKTIYFVQYSDNLNSPIAVDLSKYSEHMFKSGIRDIMPLNDPFTQLIVLLNDFTWVQCTFDLDDAEFPIIAWHRHQTFEGGIASAIASDFGRGQEFCIMSTRKNGLYFERMNNIEYTHKSMDMWSKFSVERVEPGVFRIVGARPDYLGMALTAVHKNSVIGLGEQNYEVEGDNLVFQFDDNAIDTDDVIFLGVSYLSRVVTLPKETGDLLNSLIASKRRNFGIYVNVVNSYAPTVNGQRLAERSPTTPFDTAEPFADGQTVYRNLGWDDSGEIVITQELPFRSEILSIASETSIERND